jgi:hypothetical protein
MDFLHNRFLVDYAQHIIYNLLQRSEGAPFLGTGEKYFSVIDDTEIEIIKCIWEEPATYLRYAPPRRIWGAHFPELGDKTIGTENKSYFFPSESYKGTFHQLALNTLEALDKLEVVKDKSNVLVFDNMQRGVFFMLAIQMKTWDKVYFYKGFQKSFAAIQSHLVRFPEYEHYKDKLTFFDTKNDTCDLSLIPEPAILISNRTPAISTEWISPKPDGADTIIDYIGRI